MPTFRLLIRAMRVHQWVKNLLVFVPLVMAHLLVDPEALMSALGAFVSFSLIASAVYISNDILDRESDRAHPIKKSRPIASGALSISLAAIVVPILTAASFLTALKLPLDFIFCLVVYLLVNFLYSTILKQIAVADIIVLAGLYTLRILAGGYAANVSVSQWLLAFSMFFFLSLACLKRFSELRLLGAQAPGGAEEGVPAAAGPLRRGYLYSDSDQISQLGSACGCLSVLVFALYTSSKDVSALYSRPDVLWLACPLLFYWLSRIWIIARRGLLHDDPILFAVKDWQSYVTGILLVFVFIFGL